MIGGVGDRKLRRRQREHPRDVDRDVAGSDDDRMLALQVDLQPAVVGVAVVPGDELGRGMRAAQLLARDPEPPVDRRAERVQDDVVVLEQLAAGDVAAELDMPEEPEALVLGGLVVRAGDRLDLRVVRGDARPHESVRRGQAVVEVDGERRLVDGQQLARRRRSRSGRRPRWRREGARSCLQGRGWRLDRGKLATHIVETDFSLPIATEESKCAEWSSLGRRSPGCGRRRPLEPEGSTASWSWWATSPTCRTRGRRCRRSCWPASTRRNASSLPSDALRRAVAPGRARDEARSRPAAGRARRRRRAPVRPADPRHRVQGATLARRRRRAGGRPRPAQPRRRDRAAGRARAAARGSSSWARASSAARSPRPRASRAST